MWGKNITTVLESRGGKERAKRQKGGRDQERRTERSRVVLNSSKILIFKKNNPTTHGPINKTNNHLLAKMSNADC